jgi:D-lactate dehydrogenase
MAPFVETEWGAEAYGILRRIKNVVDPGRLLNPGVILNDDANAHIRHLKDLPSVEEEVDRCIECGYCEHKCPSRNITTTPRRRIVVRRVLKNLELAGDTANYKLLRDQFQYDGMDTCAIDGLCATACPVDINTGDLVKRLRRENHSFVANKIALLLAKNFRATEWVTRTALGTGVRINKIFGSSTMLSLTRALKRLISGVPLWSNQIGYPPDLSVLRNKKRSTKERHPGTTVIYFPACISRTMGSYDGKNKNLLETFMSVCQKSGIDVIVSEPSSGTCCGQIFSSKGFHDAYRFTANQTIERLWSSSKEGTFPVVIDVSSCAYTLRQMGNALTKENKIKFGRLTILDSVEFLHDMVLPLSQVSVKQKDIVLHPVCSLQKMHTEEKFLRVAKHFAHEVTIPKNAGCCGMAGDRGFLFPELTASATGGEASEVQQRKYDGYYSTTKTCEMALSHAVKENYVSILYLIDEVI